jgi:hypothetical protein
VCQDQFRKYSFTVCAYLLCDLAVTFTLCVLLHSNIFFPFVVQFGPAFIPCLQNLSKYIICTVQFISHTLSWDSMVGTQTRLWTGKLMNHGFIPGTGNIFLFKASTQALGPSLLFSGYWGLCPQSSTYTTTSLLFHVHLALWWSSLTFLSTQISKTAVAGSFITLLQVQ